MMLSKTTALLASISLLAGLSACQPHLQYRVPTLNEADAERQTCADFPDFEAMLRKLPAHVWLAGSDEAAVVTPDGRTWVAFDVVQMREAAMLHFGGVDARGAHFECFDDLEWMRDTWAGLEE